MKPSINLATHGHMNRRAVFTVYAIIGVVLVLTLVSNLRFWANSMTQTSRIDTHIAELEKQLGIDSDAPPVSDAEFNAQLKKIRFSNQVIAKDSYRWTELLGQLETVILDNIRITSVNPLFKEERIALSGEAKRVEDLETFLDALEESSYFYDILLLSQADREIDRNNPQSRKVISFTLKVGGGKA